MFLIPASLKTFAARSLVNANSTLVHAVFCVRNAPAITSKRDSAGHQCWRPQAVNSVLNIPRSSASLLRLGTIRLYGFVHYAGKLSSLSFPNLIARRLFFATLLLVALRLYAQQNVDEITAVPNRPTFSTTAETVQRGVFEIEAGWEAGDGLQDLNALLKFGALKNLELRVLNDPVLRQNGVTGIGDLGAGFKYRFLSETHRLPTTSVLYTATIPSATSDLGLGAIGHAVLLLLSKDLGKNHIDINEGVQFVGRSGTGQSGFDRNYFSALSYSRAITEKWGFSGEVAGYSRLNSDTPASMTILGAGTYTMRSRLVFDFGAYVAAFGELPRITFFSGVTYSVADLYRHRRTARHSGN